MTEDGKKLSRRSFLKTAGILLGTLGAGQIGFELWKEKQRNEATADLIEGSTVGFNQAEIDLLPEEVNQAGVLATPTPFQPTTPTNEVPETLEPTPTPTPTPEIIRIAEGYILSETIDLADHTKPIVMAIQLKKKKDWIISTIASPHPYTEENDEKNVFHPSKNTIESYIANEDVPTTWVHSGTWNEKPLFANEIELFLRKPNGATATPEESRQAFQQELIGAPVFIFQGENAQSFPNNMADLLINPKDFRGNILELTFSSGIRIPRWKTKENGKIIDNVEKLSEHVMDIYDWVGDQYPNSGFSSVPRNNLWGIKFCGAPLLNEAPYNEVYSIQYARWVLGLSVPEN